MKFPYTPEARHEEAPPPGEPYPTVALVEEALRTHGPAVYGRLGINPANDLRFELNTLFNAFVDERSEGRLPDFVDRNFERLERDFLDALRTSIAALAKQVVEPLPAPDPTAHGTGTAKGSGPGATRRGRRTRFWR